MRRPALYLAGLFLATGASLALASPAMASDTGFPFGGDSYAASDNDTSFYQQKHNSDNVAQNGLINVNKGGNTGYNDSDYNGGFFDGGGYNGGYGGYGYGLGSLGLSASASAGIGVGLF
ncbi:hypothetical protein [Actinoplanes sp. NPDC051851]|uniref:hypothetical protein n=1 Tax=Actinoplanes sp. NPDC051851 TaxID=3154753 RepID=UPI003420CA68